MKLFLWPESILEFSCENHQADIEDPAYCYLDWMKNHYVTDGVLSDCYAQAADKIIDHRLSKPQSNLNDGLFMPVAYLYRHSIELNIKELIRFFISNQHLENTKNV